MTTMDISSIGRASALLQQMPKRITAAAAQLRIEPVLRINGVDHYDDTDLQKIRQYLTERREGG